jgi:hypothetical protein
VRGWYSSRECSRLPVRCCLLTDRYGAIDAVPAIVRNVDLVGVARTCQRLTALDRWVRTGFDRTGIYTNTEPNGTRENGIRPVDIPNGGPGIRTLMGVSTRRFSRPVH